MYTKKTLDKINNDDPNYEQKVQDIMEVATAEVLVSKAEKKKHITAAEKTLEVASKETAGGSLIEGKDELIKSLRDRLDKATGKVQTPSAKETYVNKINSYISGVLKGEQANSYQKLIDQAKSHDDYEEKINEVLNLALIENLINRAHSNPNKRT